MRVQWLIDEILKLIPPSSALVIRPQYTSEDFTLPDFDNNNAWHDLDLSGIVPDKAYAVVANLRIGATASSESTRWRTKGSTTEFGAVKAGTYPVGSIRWHQLIIACDSDRIIQYRNTPGSWTYLDFNVYGWFLGP